MIPPCAAIVILIAAKDLAWERAKSSIRGPDPSASPQDDGTHCDRPEFLIFLGRETGGSVKRSLAMAQFDREKSHRQGLRP